MLQNIQTQWDHLVNRTLNRSLRLAVTGLSQSGKTAFITSLVNQLLTINQGDNHHLPFFSALRNKQIIATQRVKQENWSIPRFDYEANLAKLKSNPSQWPESTRGIGEIRIAIRYRRIDGLFRHLKEEGTLYLDIFDYPGEWLLDLPLLESDFKTWSQSLLPLHYGLREELAHSWLTQVKALDLSAPANEEVIAQLAASYTEYLHLCKQQGLQFIQPGHFVLPGEYAGAPALQFFPLIHLSDEAWSTLMKNADKNSYFYLLNQRFNYYRDHIVKGFYQNYFTRFDRQVVLADCLTPLNYSQQAFKETQVSLQQLFNHFSYGNRTFLNRLFSSKIDKLLFVATKADHITSDQIPNLISLMRQLIGENEKNIQFLGLQSECTAVAAIRATHPVMVTENGEKLKALQGIRSTDKQSVVVYPGSVPNQLPHSDFWQSQPFQFDQFEPLPLDEHGRIRHFKMDNVLQFLLADQLD